MEVKEIKQKFHEAYGVICDMKDHAFDLGGIAWREGVELEDNPFSYSDPIERELRAQWDDGWLEGEEEYETLKAMTKG